MERATLGDRALNRDLPAHQSYQPRGDSQAQTRAAMMARGRAVGLGERFKNEVLLVRGDADPRVADSKVQPDLVRADRDGFDADHHFPDPGELDGVTHQVEDD